MLPWRDYWLGHLSCACLLLYCQMIFFQHFLLFFAKTYINGWQEKKGRRSSSQVLLGSKRKIWLIFVLNSHTENGTVTMLYEKYEKMLKWNNVIKSLQYTIIIIHFFLKFYFFENASKTHKGPSCNRNAQKIFKAGKLLCSFLSIARLESLQNVSRGFKHVDAIPKLVTYCCMFFL